VKEKEFESLFTQACILYKCFYMKIPDTIITKEMIENASKRGRVKDREKPVDGIFVSKEGVMALEFKANYGPDKKHQVDNAEKSNAIIAGAYLFVRCKKSKNKDVFTIEIHDRFGKVVVDTFSDLRALVYGLVEYQAKLKALNVKINLDSNPAGNKVES